MKSGLKLNISNTGITVAKSTGSESGGTCLHNKQCVYCISVMDPVPELFCVFNCPEVKIFGITRCPNREWYNASAGPYKPHLHMETDSDD